MPLEILGPLVICGISLTVLAVYFSGISKPAILTDSTAAQKLFLKDYGDTSIEKTFLTADKSAGFMVLSQNNAVGLVEAMGSRFLTRVLEVGDVKQSTLSDKGLEVQFNDFTHKKQHYAISNSKDATAIHQALAALKPVQGSNP